MKIKRFSKEIGVLLNITIAFFAIVAFLYLIAPLCGGVFYISAVVYYSSFIGIILFIKFFLKKYAGNIAITKTELLLKIGYESVCYFLWFNKVVALVCLLSGLLVNILGYRAYRRKLDNS